MDDLCCLSATGALRISSVELMEAVIVPAEVFEPVVEALAGCGRETTQQR
jgi:hypothetical protein